MDPFFAFEDEKEWKFAVPLAGLGLERGDNIYSSHVLYCCMPQLSRRFCILFFLLSYILPIIGPFGCIIRSISQSMDTTRSRIIFIG